jgi:enamine deaminase RidA (YjgF/YER057c/UK114 family)
MTPEEKLGELGLEFPPAPKPAGVYVPCLIVGDLAYVSGHGPVLADGTMIIGKVGATLSLEDGKAAAQQVGLTILSTLKSSLGDLSRVKRVVKVLGMVNSTADFADHPMVINGCSELFAAVFGSEKGVGARSAVGMNSLPSDIPVEIEALFQLR